jgi:hypothetical protein
MIRAVAALQRLQGLPADGLRLYSESSLHWVLWYLGAPVLLLACVGAAALGGRSVESLLQLRSRASVAAADADAEPAEADDLADAGDPAVTGDPDPVPDPDPSPDPAAAPAPASVLWLWGLPWLIVAWSVVTVLWDPSVVPWQPMASHRLVPVVLPGLVLLGAWMSSWLTSRASAFGASRGALVVVGTCCVLAMAVPPLVTTLNPGLAHSPAASASAASAPSASSLSSRASKLAHKVQLRGVGATATYGGSVAAAAALCAAIGPSASVLVTDASTAATFAPVIRGMCGQPVALMPPAATAAASATALEQAVRAVQQAGRRPVLLGPSRSSVSLPGTLPQQAVSLHTSGDAESLNAAPTSTWPVTYSAWLAAPVSAGG